MFQNAIVRILMAKALKLEKPIRIRNARAINLLTGETSDLNASSKPESTARAKPTKRDHRPGLLKKVADMLARRN